MSDISLNNIFTLPHSLNAAENCTSDPRKPVFRSSTRLSILHEIAIVSVKCLSEWQCFQRRVGGSATNGCACVSPDVPEYHCHLLFLASPLIPTLPVYGLGSLGPA